MKKKHLFLIAVVAVLIVVVTVAFAQLLTQNNKASNPSPSFPSSSTSQSLTPEEIATLKADSFELELKDNFQSSSDNEMTFYRFDSNLYNATVTAQYIALHSNFTSVSETTFLSDILNYLKLGLYSGFSVTRVDNIFYLTINSYAYPQIDATVSCTP
jgi:hypothetical protein